jgi:alkanesulfonate monooxygenase SsuD/methylene tetrahydromethanopterin reductase-like flavin-dependent oxidoreductase (luciferase family)
MPSPNLMAAALARRTRDVKLIVLGNSVVNYNPPLRVAEEFAMLDCISGGRLVCGFPVGTAMDTVFAYGQNPATLRDKYREGVDLILRAWTAPKPFAFNGKYTQLRYVNPWPRPLQQPYPPIWIPGGGSIETWDWTVRNDFLYACLSYWGYEYGKRTLDGFWEVVDRLGAEPNPYRAGFLQFVAVADDDAEAERLYAKHAEYFYNLCLHVNRGYLNPPGYTTIATIRAGLKGQLEQAERERASALLSGGRHLHIDEAVTWQQIVDRKWIIAGSPQTIVQHLELMAKTLRCGHIMHMLQFGSMPKELVRYNTERFARDVLPHVRGHFAEWEDRWWPTGTLPADRTAAPA